MALSERIVHQHAYTGEVLAQQGNTPSLLCPFDSLPTMDAGWPWPRTTGSGPPSRMR
ncbi:hypothetical protein [Streptomyces sp. NPDC046805]|uniref:hypothetical protein n=1 Tax=Streptomyces sp. NPDC046805 TaxID=3155134 RepID=UPI0033E488C3